MFEYSTARTLSWPTSVPLFYDCSFFSLSDFFFSLLSVAGGYSRAFDTSSVNTPPATSTAGFLLGHLRRQEDSGYDSSHPRLSSSSLSTDVTPSTFRRSAVAAHSSTAVAPGRAGHRQVHQQSPAICEEGEDGTRAVVKQERREEEEEEVEEDGDVNNVTPPKKGSGACVQSLRSLGESSIGEATCSSGGSTGAGSTSSRHRDGTPRTPTPFKKALAELEKKGGRVTLSVGVLLVSFFLKP